MAYRWMIAPPLSAEGLAAFDGLNCSKFLAQCLWNRGFASGAVASSFLEPRLRQLADPFLLPDMDRAVDRLLRAREDGESIMVFGDYDVDGITSTAILTEVLEALGWAIDCYLPHRMDDGYGLSAEGVANCLKTRSPKVLIAVDCGSTATATIAELNARGIDVIVLDHHQISNPAPAATALVNPHRSDGSGQFKELCSAGLAFKLSHAVVKRGRQIGLPGADDYDVRSLLDLTALGTIADLTPLTGENRILTAAGLERLNVTQRPGLQALCAVAGITSEIGVYEVGFLLAPRLNAAGRLETAERALQLVRARTHSEAEPIAHELDARNRERQQIERRIADEAIGAVRAKFNEDCLVIVEGQLLWHIGVVGIVASRVAREFYRPAIIIGGEGKEWRGSGRSIEGFDLAAALRECESLLIRHGGHAMAAGLSIDSDRVDEFREAINRLARERLQGDVLAPPLRLDAEATLAELALSELEPLARLKPHGQGNPEPLAAIRGVAHRRPPQRFGKENRHARLYLTDPTGQAEAVRWNVGDGDIPSGPLDLAVAPQIDTFGGGRRARLKILDWRPASRESERPIPVHRRSGT